MRRSQLFDPATSIRRAAMSPILFRDGGRDRVGKRVGVGANADQITVLGVEAANLGEIGGHDGIPIRQVLVQLGRDRRSRCTR